MFSLGHGNVCVATRFLTRACCSFQRISPPSGPRLNRSKYVGTSPLVILVQLQPRLRMLLMPRPSPPSDRGLIVM